MPKRSNAHKIGSDSLLIQLEGISQTLISLLFSHFKTRS